MGVQAQYFGDYIVKEVLASDDFETIPAWTNFDSDGLDLTLNNALGGTQEFSWGDTWGGACVHGGKSAVSGNCCVQLHWGGTLLLQGFEIDQSEVYQIEVMVHPQGGMSGEWNNWAAMHLYVYESSNVWQTQGVRMRLSNNDSSGGSPSLLGLDVWEGEDGEERAINLISFSDRFQELTIDDAADPTVRNFWIPLKIVFSGEGTAASPIVIDFYLNDVFVGTESFDDVYWLGDFMVGLQNGSDNEDLTRYDNFKISTMKKGNAIDEVNQDKLFVAQKERGQLTINSGIYGSNAEYRLFNAAGATVAKGFVPSATTQISTANLVPGMYILQVRDNRVGEAKVVKVMVK